MTSVTDRPDLNAPRPVTEADPEAVRTMMARLRATYASGRTRDVTWRLRQLDGILKMLEEREADIIEALTGDLGRAAHDSWMTDVAGGAAECRFTRKHLRRWMRRQHTGMPLNLRPGKAFYQYEPLGVVLLISPWNYPIYLTISPLISALAAGNCAVIKPSEHTPRCSALMVELFAEYLDPDAVAVVEGEAATTTLLIDQAMDHIIFTGAPVIGKLIMERAARYLTPVTLELGGKSPVIVTKKADLKVAARRIAWSKLLNSGQTCIAPDYAIVEEEVRDKLVEQLIETVHAFRAEETGGQRIVNARQFDRVTSLLDGAGGRTVLGGGSDRDSLTVEPTVIVDPERGSRLMDEEIFGPILPVLTVKSLTEAFEIVNSKPKPLGAYLFSSSKAEHERLLAEVSSGGAVINHLAMHCLVPNLPFGGVGNSGMGAHHGEFGFQTFSHRKAVLYKPTWLDPTLIYPPYTELAKKIIRKAF
ncbi:MAG TPA: aldehyde dehydrogenase family protein [Pseudonocardia sp.]|jgi:aldehyde dehydrogenase (NAD+)